MPLCCCGEKEPVFGKSIENMLDNILTVRNDKRMVPIEIQQFINYLSERNALQFKELFLNSSDPKEKKKLIKKINKAGTIDLKDTHDIHLVISVFIEFLRRMPGRVISREQLTNFKHINNDMKAKNIKKVQEGLNSLPQQRFETLKYLMTFFMGKIGNNNFKVNIETLDTLSLAPIIAAALIETPNDYTLPSKIYKNGNIINYIPNTNNVIETIKRRENIIRILIMNYNKFFTNEKQEIPEKKKPKLPKYNPEKISDNKNEVTKSYSRSCPVCDSPVPPKMHMRISSKQCTKSRSISPTISPTSTLHENYDFYSINDKNNNNNYNYDYTINSSDKSLSYDNNNNLFNNKSNFDIQNLNYKIIGDKIHLSFTLVIPDNSSQNYKLEIPQSGTGLASIRNTSLSRSDSSTQFFRVTSFTEKPRYSSDSDSTIDNSKNLELKLNLPVFQEKKLRSSNSYSNSNSNSNSCSCSNTSISSSSSNSKYNSNSNSFINIKYPQNTNTSSSSSTRSIVVQPDESVIIELQLFLKATRRYLYDLQSFPTGQIKELFKFSKQRYKLIKDVISDSPYINLEPIMNSPMFGPNKCFVLYEGLDGLSLAQKTLMEYDLYMKTNNIKEFIFQKTKEQCQMEKEFLYQKLVVLKNNIKTENDRHILHELNKIYNNIRENLKRN